MGAIYVSDYDSDGRVRRVNEYHFIVQAPGDEYHVSAVKDEHDWWIDPTIGGASYRAAGIKNREDAEAWAARTSDGPYRTAGEAIRKLIGEPQLV
jgi:hypothetical protein